MALTLQLYRTVQIANKRLNVLYVVMNITAIVLCCYLFISDQQYTVKIPVAPSLSLRTLDKSLELLGANLSFPHLCRALGWKKINRNHDLGVYADFTYWKKSCGTICSQATSADEEQRRIDSYRHLDAFWKTEVLRDCQDLGELVRVTNSAELGITTRIRVAYFGANITYPSFFQDPTPELHGQTREPGDYIPSNSSIILEVYYPSAMGVLIDFTYTVELQSSASSKTLGFGANSAIRNTYTNKHSLTVVVDQTFDIYRVYQPGDRIVQSLADVVFLARTESVPQSIINTPAFRKQFFESTGVTSEGNEWVYRELPPVIYRNGASVSGHVNCYNTDRDLESRVFGRGRTKMWTDVHASFAQPVCILEFSFLADELRHDSTKRGPGTAQLIFNNKVNIVGQRGDSYQRAISLSSCLFNVAAILVLVSVPNIILRFITLNLCGELSAVYKRTVVQPFDIRSQCGSVAAKLMSQSIAFLELADQRASDGHKVISIQRMVERLRATLYRHSVLDEAEIQNLGKFCFDEVANGRRHGFGLGDIGALCHTGHLAKHSTKKDLIDIDSFSVAMSKNDGLDFQSIVDLFDTDRRRNPVERFFTPNDIAIILRKHRETTKSPDGEQPIPRTQSTMSIEDSKKVFEERFARLYDMMTQEGNFAEELLAVQTRQVKMESEIKWLYSQVDKIKSNTPSLDSRLPSAEQVANVGGYEGVVELRQEIHVLKEALKISKPSQQELPAKVGLPLLQPLIERVAVLEDRFEQFRSDSSLHEMSRQNVVAAQHGSSATDKSAVSVDATSTFHVTQLTQRVETLETWCSEQFALLEKQCNERLLILETAVMRTAEASSAEPVAFESRQNSRQRCVDDWSSFSCVQRDRIGGRQ